MDSIDKLNDEIKHGKAAKDLSFSQRLKYFTNRLEFFTTKRPFCPKHGYYWKESMSKYNSQHEPPVCRKCYLNEYNKARSKSLKPWRKKKK